MVVGAFVVTLLTSMSLSLWVSAWTQRGLSSEYSFYLNNYVSDMAALLKEVHTQQYFKDQDSFQLWLSAKMDYWPYYTRLLSTDGTVVGESEDMPVASDQLAAELDKGGELALWTGPDGRKYALARQQVQEGEQILGQVLVARDLSDEIKYYEKMREMLIAMSLLGSVLIGFFTWVVSRYMLSPLKRMQLSIDRIGVSELNTRLSSARWPQELRPIAQTFDGMLDRLEDNFKRLSQFSSDLAHELRTPLHNLTVELDVILAQPRNAAEYRLAVESVQEGVAYLSRLVSELLFIARVESGRDALDWAVLNTAEQVHKVEEFFQPMLDERGVRFLNETSGTIDADEMKLRRALVNLVGNALRHTPPGKKITVRSVTDHKGIWLMVLDEGSGIPPEALPRIFDRFYKVDSARYGQKGTFSGSGLGLPIVSSIMKLHGGTADASNRPGGGASFKLFFPRKKTST